MRTNAVISVVDDDEAFRAGLVDLFRSAGLQVRDFGSAEELMQSPVLPAMACLIIDLRMPGKSGLALRSELAGRGLEPPTILMTAYATPQVRQEAAMLGISVIEKPADPELVLAEVDRCLRLSGPHA